MDFLHNMANALLEEETIDSTAVENLHKYGTTKAPDETEAPTDKSYGCGDFHA